MLGSSFLLTGGQLWSTTSCKIVEGIVTVCIANSGQPFPYISKVEATILKSMRSPNEVYAGCGCLLAAAIGNTRDDNKIVTVIAFYIAHCGATGIGVRKCGKANCCFDAPVASVVPGEVICHKALMTLDIESSEARASGAGADTAVADREGAVRPLTVKVAVNGAFVIDSE